MSTRQEHPPEGCLFSAMSSHEEIEHKNQRKKSKSNWSYRLPMITATSVLHENETEYKLVIIIASLEFRMSLCIILCFAMCMAIIT